MNTSVLRIQVWGEFACFSRPEMKVERFSYPVITPSAARGIFDAIYCKPKEFRWQMTRVEVLPPRGGGKGPPGIHYIALRRNEVKEKAALGKLDSWRRRTADPEPIFADVAGKDFWNDDTRGRTQRQTMALKDVHYRLHAEIRPWPGFEGCLQGIAEQFRRRASHGKCVYQPCFGCREFPAYFELAGADPPSPAPMPINLDVGLMLYDVFDLSRPGTAEDAPCISLFPAAIVDGVLDVPEYASDHVLRAARRER